MHSADDVFISFVFVNEKKDTHILHINISVFTYVTAAVIYCRWI